MNKRALVFIAEGFEEIEALTIIDILRKADIDTKMISITGKILVKGAHSITIETDFLIENIDATNVDILILPGGMPGSTHLKNHSQLATILTNHSNQNKLIAAICAAPLVLGGLGILQGKEATCYPGYENTLQGATSIAKAVVTSENIITGNGPGSAAEFAFTIVDVLGYKEKAENLKKGMMYV